MVPLIPTRRKLITGAAASAAMAALPRKGRSQGFGLSSGPVPSIFNDGGYYACSGFDIGPTCFWDSATGTEWYFWLGFNALSGVNQEVIECAVRTRATNTWQSSTIGANSLVLDPHAVPAACKIGNYAYVCWGAHFGAGLQQAVTTNPNDPTAWTVLPTLAGTFTIQKVFFVGGKLWLLYLAAGSTGDTQQAIIIRSATVSGNTVTWGAPISIIDANQVANRGWLPLGRAYVSGNDIIMSFTYARTAGAFPFGVYVAVYNTATGAVRNFANTFSVAAGSLPVIMTDIDAHMLVVDQLSTTSFGTQPDMAVDSGSATHLTYASSQNAGTGPTNVLHIVNSGGGWSAPSIIYNYPLGNAADVCAILCPNGTGMDVYFNDASFGATFLDGNMLKANRPSGGVWTNPTVMNLFTRWSYYLADRFDGHPDALMYFAECSITTWSAAALMSGNLRGHAFGNNGFIGQQLPDRSVLNISDHSANLTVTNALTATCTMTNTNGNVARSSTSHSAGKYHVEFTINVDTGGATFIGIGLIAAAQSVTAHYLGDTGNNSIGNYGNSNIYQNNGSIANSATFAAGNTIGMEINLDANPKTVVFITKTGAKTVPISLALLPSPLFVGVDCENVNQKITVNFGGLPFAYPPAAGYGIW